MDNQWDNIEKEKMWLWATIMPTDTKIEITLAIVKPHNISASIASCCVMLI